MISVFIGYGDSCIGTTDATVASMTARCLYDGPCHRYYLCHNHVTKSYHYCGDNTECLIKGVCGKSSTYIHGILLLLITST